MIYRGTVCNGMIKLNDGAILPDGTPVSVEPLPTAQSPEDTAWPADYFEQTFGSIADDTFLRAPQGELPKPVELE